VVVPSGVVFPQPPGVCFHPRTGVVSDKVYDPLINVRDISEAAGPVKRMEPSLGEVWCVSDVVQDRSSLQQLRVAPRVAAEVRARLATPNECFQRRGSGSARSDSASG
jgi:hypothetical protein